MKDIISLPFAQKIEIPYLENWWFPMMNPWIPWGSVKSCFHGIVIIREKNKNTLSHFIGSLKSFSSRKIGQISNLNSIWQRSFHDRIIRDEVELYQVRNYIRNNPRKWILDDMKKVA